MMAQAGIPVEVIARLNDRSTRYVGEYLARNAPPAPAGTSPPPLVLHDQPRPRPANLPDPDRRFRVRLAELEAFLAANGRRPHISRDTVDRSRGTEWALAHWLTMARSNDRNGRLAEHRARWLDQVLPSWRVDDRSIAYEARWRQNLARLLLFIDTHGSLPVNRPRTAEPGEIHLAGWLSDQRTDLRDRRLLPERKVWLDRLVPRWRHRRASPRPTR